MANQHVPHTDLRKAGLAAALVVGLLLAAGMAVVVLMRPSPAPTPQGTRPPPGGSGPEVPPDIVDRGVSTRTAKVQFADRNDPGRAAGMIEWASLEPVSQVEKLLTEPRGYVYLRDGGLIVVSSRSGRLNTAPKVEEPQSGRFEGGVTLKLYPAGADPKTDQPSLTATSDTLDFDMPSASIATTGPFNVVSTSFDIDGRGMRLIVNQVEEGVERFEVAHVTKVLFRPDAKDPFAPKDGAARTPGAKPAAKGPDRLRTYRAVIDGAVKLTQAGRVMSAERVEAWAHLVNNRFPQGAIGRFGPDPIPAAPGAVAPAEKPDAAARSAITGEWTGRLVVTPVNDNGENAQPKEFGDNKLALRLHAGQTPVTVHDESFKGRMTAARVDFGATSRDLTLASTPSMPVEIDVDGTGKLVGKGAAVNLGTGKVDLTGGGTLTPAPAALARATDSTPEANPAPASKPPSLTAAPTTLHFNNTLALQFATAGNFITPDLRSANITGG
ncbi:MAG TPA: hypothetical protein VFF65_00615, partial [Phycisphaerales bacterium]|nr:hypothetical protein [Phycisphaerales bacterium]